MLPENLQVLSKFLPLTYSNAGFKAVIYLGDYALLMSNATVLAIFFGAPSLLAFVVFLVSFKSVGTPKSPKIV